MFLGYTDWQETMKAVDGNGYFHTGDLVRAGPEGSIVVSGRLKDLIIRGGENLSAKEIEDVLSLHPAIQEARSEEHTSELQSLMRISYAVFCLKKKMHDKYNQYLQHINR